jgi:hypothetical protein
MSRIDNEGRKTFTIDGHNANFKVGINGNGGNIEVHDETGKRSIYLNGPQAELVAGSFDNAGAIAVLDASGKKTIRLNGRNAALYLVVVGLKVMWLFFLLRQKPLQIQNRQV